MIEELSYTEAFDELRLLVNEMDQGNVNVDELAQKVKRAAELIRLCKNKLQATEGDVQAILKELEEE
jgi:exodeoxyribonuclease VII small subunit